MLTSYLMSYWNLSLFGNDRLVFLLKLGFGFRAINGKM